MEDQMENCLGDAWFCDAGQGVDQYSQRTQSLGENRQWETRRGPVSEMRGSLMQYKMLTNIASVIK